MGDRKVCVVGAGYRGKNHIRTLYELDSLGGIGENNTVLLQEILCGFYGGNPGGDPF